MECSKCVCAVCKCQHNQYDTIYLYSWKTCNLTFSKSKSTIILDRRHLRCLIEQPGQCNYIAAHTDSVVYKTVVGNDSG